MSRDDLDRVLDRLRDDRAFRARLAADPAAALAGLALDDDALRRLEEELLGADVVGFGAGPARLGGLFAPGDADGPGEQVTGAVDEEREG